MKTVTLDQATQQLGLWEGAAAALARGRPYEINGKPVTDADAVRTKCALWRRVCDALARRAQDDLARRFGARTGQGRRVAGIARRVR